MNWGTVLIAPVGSPSCRRLIVPLKRAHVPRRVRVDEVVEVHRHFEAARPPKLNCLEDAEVHDGPRVGSRSEPSGSTFTVLLPPTVCATVTCRVTAMPLCEFKLRGDADVVPRQYVGPRQLELVRPVAELPVDDPPVLAGQRPSTLIRLFGLVLTLRPLMRACANV